MDIQEDRGQEQTDSRYSPASPDHLPVPYSQRSSLVPLAPVSPAHGSLQPLESSGESPVFSCSWASCLALLPWIHLSVVQSVGTEGARPQISVAATVTAGLSMSVCLAWLRITRRIMCIIPSSGRKAGNLVPAMQMYVYEENSSPRLDSSHSVACE